MNQEDDNEEIEMEKKIVLKVAIDQISMAKQLIEDKVLCCLFLHILWYYILNKLG